MEYRDTWDLTTIPDAKLRSEVGRRTSAMRKNPGRTPVYRQCPHCREPQTARNYLPHVRHCPQNPKFSTA